MRVRRTLIGYGYADNETVIFYIYGRIWYYIFYIYLWFSLFIYMLYVCTYISHLHGDGLCFIYVKQQMKKGKINW